LETVSNYNQAPSTKHQSHQSICNIRDNHSLLEQSTQDNMGDIGQNVHASTDPPTDGSEENDKCKLKKVVIVSILDINCSQSELDECDDSPPHENTLCVVSHSGPDEDAHKVHYTEKGHEWDSERWLTVILPGSVLSDGGDIDITDIEVSDFAKRHVNAWEMLKCTVLGRDEKESNQQEILEFMSEIIETLD
jgi:hypothetical protein